MAQDQVRADRRNLVQPRFAELALDVIFLRETEAAMRLDALIGRIPARFRCQQLGHVRLGTARLACIKHRRGLVDHQGRRRQLHMGAGDRELDTLILADRPTEDSAVFGIGGSAIDEEAAVSDTFGRNQDAFGIHAVQHIFDVGGHNDVARLHQHIQRLDRRGRIT